MSSEFEFKVLFLDEDERILDKDKITIRVAVTEDSEEDRDNAYSQCDDWATEQLDERGADNFEISLIDAH